MKRSRVNEIIREADAFIRSFGYIMPPFAYWSPEELKEKRPAGIVDARLGWDITDYGQRQVRRARASSCSPCATAAPRISPAARACSTPKRS